MSYFDDNEDYIIYGRPRRPPARHAEPVTCNRCMKGGLHFDDFGSGWKLYEHNGSKHVCGAVPSADDFDDIT